MRASPRAWHFVATAAVLAALFAAAYLFFVHGYMGQLIDEQARVGAQVATGESVVTRVLDAVPLLSAGAVVLAVVIGLLRRQGAATLVALGMVAAANLTTQLLKHELLERPDNGATGSWHNSFPSGHTTVFVSAVFALFLVCGPRVRPFIAALGAAGSIVVGAMLVESQWHRPSDVVGGILVVAVFVFLGGAVLARRSPRSPGGSQRGAPVSAGALLAVAAVVSAGAFALAYVTTDAAASSTTAATVAGLVAISATVAAVSTLAALLFRRIA